MTNTASILVLIFLAVTFVQSAYDKVFAWKGNVEWLKGHFSNTSLLKNNVPLALGIILLLELITGVLTLVGCVQLLINGERTFGYYGAVFFLYYIDFVTFRTAFSKRLRWGSDNCYLFRPGCFSGFLVELKRKYNKKGV